jgi:hypothetical protein
MSNLSELLPSGAGQNQVEFVASGTLPNGKPVILKADGTVEVVGIGSTPVSESIPSGSITNVNGTSASFKPRVSFDPNTAGKCAVLFRDDSVGDHGKVAIGTISGTTVTFGTPGTYRDAGYMNSGQAIAYNPNVANQLMVFYNLASPNNCYSKVGTVSGTSISFGSAVQFKSGPADHLNVSFDPSTNGKFILSFQDGSNNSYGASIVGTLSGTTASYGSVVLFNSVYTPWNDISYDPSTAGKCLVAYADNNSTKVGKSKVGTVSGTGVSFGSSATFNSGVTDYICLAADNTAGKYVIAYKHTSEQMGYAIVASVSGSTVSYGTAAYFNSTESDRIGIACDPNTTGKFVIVSQEVSAGRHGQSHVGTISGTSLTFGSKQEFAAVEVRENRVAFNPSPASAGQFYISFNAGGIGKAILGQMAATAQATNLTSTNLIGISAADAADTATAKINVWGGINSSVVPPAGALTTYAITVANASGNKYFIDTVQQDTPALTEGNTYKFDQSDSTNSGHPLRFSTTSNGSHGGGSVYSSGVTVVGTPGNAGSYTQIVVPTDAPTLYYYCTAHSGMGGSATTPAAAALIIGSDYYVHTDGSITTTTTGGQKIGTAISTTTINMKDLT